MNKITVKEMAKYIDHTALKATTSLNEVKVLCEEADKYKFASVCINPYFVPFAKEFLKGSSVKVCTVIGFPLGASTSEAKAAEAIKAVADGANEVDMVLNVSAMKSSNYEYVERDIRVVVSSIPKDICVKVILETCYLSDEEIIKACQMAEKAGADFVKTSTGFGTGGATVHHVELMKKTVGDRLEVKASGAVRDFATASEMIKAGATRIGTSSGVAMMTGAESKSAY